MLRYVSIYVLVLISTTLIDVAQLYSQDKQPAWAAPPVERAVSIRDGGTGDVLTWDEMVIELAKADVVFLGETHLDETTHRVELSVLESLLSRKENKVVLSMEMFERDVQQHLDAYLKGETDESTFLSNARPWGNYRSAYRPLVEAAKNAKAPVIAANFPTPLRRRLAMAGPKVLENLKGAEKGAVPKELHPNTKEYWQRVDNAIRGHEGMMRGGSGDDSRLYSTQTLWDNAMGEACSLALDEHPDSLVLHVAGGFHIAYWQGTARQLLLRKPKARIKTVSIVASSNPGAAQVKGKPVADYIVFASALAADANEGKYSVTVAHDAHYKLSMPKDVPAGETVPLLIWLVDDGLNSSDGIDLWKPIFGNQVAIAVIDPRYKELQGDLSEGGRWYWPESFAEDIQSSTTTVERTWGYLLRNFPIDPERVCVAGEGSGATVAAAITLRTSRMQVQGIASQPRQFKKLKDFPLPMPAYWGDDAPPKRKLTVLGGDDIESFWSGELMAYGETTIDAGFVPIQQDPWSARSQLVNALRNSMKLGESEYVDGERKYVLANDFSPRAYHWARVQSQLVSTPEFDIVVVRKHPEENSPAEQHKLSVNPDFFAVGGAIPECPGPFGGTTVLVLPDDISDSQKQKWQKIEENDPIAKLKRFHRLRIATSGGELGLSLVLEKLASENRKNVLIVPAVFCADSNRMQRLKQIVTKFENAMTIQWLPGLGGRKALQGELTRKTTQ